MVVSSLGVNSGAAGLIGWPLELETDGIIVVISATKKGKSEVVKRSFNNNFAQVIDAASTENFIFDIST